jgi:methanogenic corrinoid protein MtbC1
MPRNIADVFRSLGMQEIEKVIYEKIAEGEDVYAILKECQDEMAKVGERFESGEFYLAELIISAKMFEKVAGILSPKIKERGSEAIESIGTIVLGTPKGDVHNLGKNIFAIMAKSAGFEVLDLGVDVPAQKFIEAALQVGPKIIGMSGLLTLVYPSMKEVVDLLKEQGLRDRVKVIIGGGATGEEARRYVGADAQTLDAAEGVRICKKLIDPSTAGGGAYDGN